MVANVVAQRLAVLGECVGVTGDEFVGPLGPQLAVELGFQRHEQRVVVEPLALAFAEGLEGIGVVRRLEAPVGVSKLLFFELRDALVADFVRGEVLRRVDVGRLEVATVGKPPQVDEQRVPGERRVGLIRGVAVGL